MPNAREAIRSRLDKLGWTAYRLSANLAGKLSPAVIYGFIVSGEPISDASLALILDCVGLKRMAWAACQKAAARCVREPDDREIESAETRQRYKNLLREARAYHDAHRDKPIPVEYLGKLRDLDLGRIWGVSRQRVGQCRVEHKIQRYRKPRKAKPPTAADLLVGLSNERIAEAMTRADVNKSQLARGLGTAWSYVHWLLSAPRNVGPERARQLAKALRCEVSDLESGSGRR